MPAKKTRIHWLFVSLTLLLVVTTSLSLLVGPLSLSPWDGLRIVLHSLGANFDNINPQYILVIENIRLPRTLLCLLVGALLAVCGAVMQGLFRNPLADPGIIGVSSGAALGAAFAIVLLTSLLPDIAQYLRHYAIALMAFIGGFVATIIVYRIGTSENGTSVAVMLLAGIAVTALASAGIGVMTYMADDAMLRDLTFWQMGSLGGANWQVVKEVGVVLLVILVLLPKYAKPLNALLLGESEARHLGIQVQKLKSRLILLTALGVGVCVSVTGLIGFVGLVVPHVIRLLIGPDHRLLLPASCLLGASLLLVADLLARTLVLPAELPIGIVTALLGGPFFISLLLKQRKNLV